VAEETLDRVSITTNKQITPDDPNPPLRPSGIRMGSPAATTRGMDENDMRRLAGWIHEALAKREDDEAIAKLREQVESFCRRFPVPGL
jgi:glycine hydroxymethyltransferase